MLQSDTAMTHASDTPSSDSALHVFLFHRSVVMYIESPARLIKDKVETNAALPCKAETDLGQNTNSWNINHSSDEGLLHLKAFTLCCMGSPSYSPGAEGQN